MVEQDAEFADMRAVEERDVRDIEAKRDEELVFTREMHRTARRLMQREFDRENDATRRTLSSLASELQFVQSLPCLAVVQPDLRREVGGARVRTAVSLSFAVRSRRRSSGVFFAFGLWNEEAAPRRFRHGESFYGERRYNVTRVEFFYVTLLNID